MSDKRRAVLRALRELQNPQPPDASRRHREAETRILQATIELVLADGWSKLTMDAIATRARVGKSTIYRWWPSKGAVLLDAVVADGFRWPAFPDTGDFARDLASAVRNLVAEFSEDSFGRLMRALLAGAQEDEHLAKELDAHLSAAPVAAIDDRIESARKIGEVDESIDPAALADLAYGAVFRRWLLGTGELDFKFADAVTAAVLRTAMPIEG
jgi:AcrR family transcriptional regulator